jgi:CDP-glucose 4,6-dehydratase
MFDNFYRNKRVFLTGHTGFKGSWLAEWLLLLGAEVHGYALDPQPHEILFDQLGLAPRLASDTRADLADRAALTRALGDARPDVVLHLAAQPLVRLSYEIPVETFATNVMGTAHLLEAVRQAGRSCAVVCITTDKCYENREWLYAYREEDAMGGHDPYSASKGAAELVIASYRRSFFSSKIQNSKFKILLASARAGNVIGGGDWAKDRIIPDCIRALRAGQVMTVRNKVATRPWQHVLEPLSGYLWLGACLAQENSEMRKLKAEIEEKEPGAELSDLRPSTLRPLDSSSSPFSCASRFSRLASELSSAFNFGPTLTSNRSVAELVQELLKHTGGDWSDASDPHAPHEASKLNLAIDKAFHLLGWQPVWDFEHTIATTAKWYLDEAAGRNVHELTIQQIQAYHAAASAKDLAWARV